MVRAYRYLFYHLHCWSARRDPSPEWTAFFTLGFAVFMNIITLLGIAEIVTRRNLFPGLPNYEIALIGMLTLVPQYFLVLNGGRYKEIERYYEFESPRERRAGNILAATYVALSFILWIGGALVLSKLRVH